MVAASEGEPLPAIPRGYSCRLVVADDPLEVARRRQVVLVRQMERSGEVVIANIGRSLLQALQASHQAAHHYVERLKTFPR